MYILNPLSTFFFLLWYTACKCSIIYLLSSFPYAIITHSTKFLAQVFCNVLMFLSRFPLCICAANAFFIFCKFQVLRTTDGSPQLNLVRLNCTIEVGVLLKCLFSYRYLLTQAYLIKDFRAREDIYRPWHWFQTMFPLSKPARLWCESTASWKKVSTYFLYFLWDMAWTALYIMWYWQLVATSLNMPPSLCEKMEE